MKVANAPSEAFANNQIEQIQFRCFVVKPTLERPFVANPKVLIVEDETLIRMLSVDGLVEAGFDVIEAVTVDEAAILLNALAPEVAVVFTDVETPGTLDGLKLAETIKHRWPTLPVVLTSGHAFPPPHLITGGVHFVPKPYDFSKVCSLIASLAHGRCNSRRFED